VLSRAAQAQQEPASRPAPSATKQADTTAKPSKAAVPATAAPAKAPPRTAPRVSNASSADTMLSRLAPRIDLRVGNDNAGGLRLSGTVGVVVMMGLLTLLPTLVLMMTGFTRIFIVLGFLRQALGTQSAPPTQLVAGLSLLLTFFVMAPTLEEVNRSALQPWMDGRMDQTQMLSEGSKPFRTFMLRQTREHDLSTFMDLSRQPRVARPEDVPLVVLTSAFVTSELRTAFQIGFALFLPFIVIDVVVASVLMSMGMMMLPPVMISLPFKLLLFVLVDGWSLVVNGLIQSFH
jgi:flagellar biosynthetic protein FliP